MSTVADARVAVTLSFDREGRRVLSAPKQVSVVVTPQLAQVFARAAAFNRTDATPLSFTSLLVGLLTSADAASSWLKQEFDRQRVPLERVAARKDDPLDINQLDEAARSYMSLPVLAASQSARDVTEEAQTIAAALRSGAVCDVRHLVAAFPILRRWHEEDFESLQIDRLSWCRAFGAQMADEYPDEKSYWRDYVDRAAPVPLTSFSADVYTEKDLLGIDRSVDALALLMASTRTDTPLSIGVFGPWGSGKSFFMRHLRTRIWSLAANEQKRVASWREKRKSRNARPEDAPLYYGRVAQVEFNAWHYNEGNLVASLVDHIFRNLRVMPEDGDLRTRQQALLTEIAKAKDGVQLAVRGIDDAQAKVKQASTTVERSKDEIDAARKVISEKASELQTWTEEAAGARSQLDAAISDLAQDPGAFASKAVAGVGLRTLTDFPVFKQIKDTGGVVVGTFEDWRAFARKLVSPKGLAAVALIAAAPFAAAPFAAKLQNWVATTFAVTVAAATTAWATLAPVIEEMRKRRTEFEKKMTQIEDEERRLHEERENRLKEEREALQKEWNEKLATLRTKLESQRTALQEREKSAEAAVKTLAERTQELDAKIQRRVQAEIELRKRETELEQLSHALLLDEFIKDRAGSDDYRKQLGFLALVRRDFERLSDLIAKANLEWCSPDQDSEPALLNRIVLYIDDLDRCRVSTVLKVLEAVHLLLAFPLFVCVVAVDPRWIEECLHQRHHYLFGIKPDGDGEHPKPLDDALVTVGDYLEKIFQIPIWMRSIDAKQRAGVVKFLLGGTAAPPPRGVSGRADLRNEVNQEPDPPSPRPDDGDGFQAVVNKALERPDPLRITADEALFVDRVGELLSDRPRALKRFVNTYRLLKASLPDLDQQDFVQPDASSPHKVCISQLAFFTGQPRLAPLLVRELECLGSSVASSDTRSVHDWFFKLPEETREPLERALKLIPDGNQMTLACFCEWLPLTSKYLFHRNDQRPNPTREAVRPERPGEFETDRDSSARRLGP
jgi:predicted  nucleic acid-binding Zn-ribbon protein